VVAWGLLCSAIVVGGCFVARAFERYWVGALVAVVPFVVALYFFYQNVNRLLPAAI
jgi:sortase A